MFPANGVLDLQKSRPKAVRNDDLWAPSGHPGGPSLSHRLVRDQFYSS